MRSMRTSSKTRSSSSTGQPAAASLPARSTAIDRDARVRRDVARDREQRDAALRHRLGKRAPGEEEVAHLHAVALASLRATRVDDCAGAAALEVGQPGLDRRCGAASGRRVTRDLERARVAVEPAPPRPVPGRDDRGGASPSRRPSSSASSTASMRSTAPRAPPVARLPGKAARRPRRLDRALARCGSSSERRPERASLASTVTGVVAAPDEQPRRAATRRGSRPRSAASRPRRSALARIASRTPSQARAVTPLPPPLPKTAEAARESSGTRRTAARPRD